MNSMPNYIKVLSPGYMLAAAETVVSEQIKLLATFTESLNDEIQKLIDLGDAISGEKDGNKITNACLTYGAGFVNRSLVNVAAVKNAVDASAKAFR